MEELIGRYFFIAIVIFATILDLVGRWYKHRQQQGRRPRRQEREERLDWRNPDAARDARERSPTPSRSQTPGLSDLAELFLEEVRPPVPWMELPPAAPGQATREAPEQPMIARVVRAPRPALTRSAPELVATVPVRAPVVVRAPAPRPRVRRHLHAALADPDITRRAILLAEILGPCRGLEPIGRRR